MLERLKAPVLLLTAAALLSACDTTGACDLSVHAGIVVEIRDAATDAPLAATARGAVRDGAYVDSLKPAGIENFTLARRAAAYERPGTYEVEVVHPGYATWQRIGVVVRPGGCHVQTAMLRALLQPAS